MVLLPDGLPVSYFASRFRGKPLFLRELEGKTIFKVFLETGMETTQLVFCVVFVGSIQLFVLPSLLA